MATVATVAQDRPFIVGLASSFTTYQSYIAAQAAAIALSASNSSNPVYTAQVEEIVTAPARVDLQTGSPTTWIVQLASTTTYLPKASAEAQAFTTSAANSNAGTFVARTFETCTGP